jgi:hypothetical protein
MSTLLIFNPSFSCVSNRLGESNNFPLKNLGGQPQGVIRQHFALPRHQMNVACHRALLQQRFATFDGWTVTAAVAKAALDRRLRMPQWRSARRDPEVASGIVVSGGFGCARRLCGGVLGGLGSGS